MEQPGAAGHGRSRGALRRHGLAALLVVLAGCDGGSSTPDAGDTLAAADTIDAADATVNPGPDCGERAPWGTCFPSYGDHICGDNGSQAECIAGRWTCAGSTPRSECWCWRLADSGGCPCTPLGFVCDDAGADSP